MIYLLLYLSFAKIGLFSFGGGYAMISFLQDTVLDYGWMTKEGFVDMIAISQMTPGPIATNMATYVGYQTGGIWGALAATIGVSTPSFIIVCFVAQFLLHFNEEPIVQSVFQGLRPAVTGLIAAAAYGIALVSIIRLEHYNKTNTLQDLIDFKGLLVAGVVMFCIYKFKKIHPIVYILAAGVFGMIFM